MKRSATRTWLPGIVLCLLLVPSFLRRGLPRLMARPAPPPQGCSNWMTPAYSTYTSYTTDGTYIYASVSVSGTTHGNCPIGCLGCNSTTHIGEAYNVLGGVGGGQWGNRVPWNGYLSAVNNQQIAATHGTEYTFTSSSEVACSARGILYSTASILDYVSIKATYGKNTLGYDDVGNIRYCGETPACSNNVIPACGNPNWADAESTSRPCYPYIAAEFLAVRASKTSPWLCSVGASSSAAGPGPCDQ